MPHVDFKKIVFVVSFILILMSLASFVLYNLMAKSPSVDEGHVNRASSCHEYFFVVVVVWGGGHIL